MKEIVLDTETTGLSYRDGDFMVEIGCVELENRIMTGREWHTYLKPSVKVNQQAFAVHGLSDEFLATQRRFSEIAADFLAFIGNHQLVIHNAPFDMGFLNNELNQAFHPEISHARVTDTLVLARQLRPGTRASLDALCAAFAIPTTAREKHHGALIDARLLAHVYIELTGGKQSALNLTRQAAQPRTKSKFSMDQFRQRTLPSRLSTHAIATHDKLIASLGKQAIWQHIKPNNKANKS